MKLILLFVLAQFSVTLTNTWINGLNAEFSMSATLPAGAVVKIAVFDCGGIQQGTWPQTWTAGGPPVTKSLRMGLGSFSTVTDCEYAVPGTYTATLTVTRANGQSITQSSTVTVNAQ